MKQYYDLNTSKSSIGIWLSTLIFLVALPSIIQAQSDVEVRVWTEPGQFYGHFCELSFEIITDTMREDT